MSKENVEDEYVEVKLKLFKFGVPGDYLVGTLVEVTKTTSADAYGKLSHIYRVFTKEGKFFGSTKNEKTKKYVLDTEQTVVNPGEDYMIFISNDKGAVLGKMGDIKVGQNFKIVFEEEKPTSKGNPAKIIKVFAGKTNQEWIDAQKSGLDEFDDKAEVKGDM